MFSCVCFLIERVAVTALGGNSRRVLQHHKGKDHPFLCCLRKLRLPASVKEENCTAEHTAESLFQQARCNLIYEMTQAQFQHCASLDAQY